MKTALTGILLFMASVLHAQDTIRVDMSQFIRVGMERSSIQPVSRLRVDLAENRYVEARMSRFLPRIELTTAHGLVPGVKSTSDAYDFPRDQQYLDPSLRNDWNEWGVFTRAEITTLQPIYSWGAITNAIEAARQGAEIARFDHQIESSRLELHLFELYQSRLLSLELKRLVDEARRDFRKAEDKLDEMVESGDDSISDADLFKFRLFREEFEGRAREVDENHRFVISAWNLALGKDPREAVVILPAESFLDPIDTTLAAFDVYEEAALRGRAELRKADAAFRAANHGLEASVAQQYPALFFAFSASYAKTPNRPRQSNPYIINSANFESIRYGIGIRQNLNFGMMRTHVNRSRLQLEQAREARNAAETGIRLDLLDGYRTASVALSRYRQATSMLQISNEWLRLEQINHDYDIGEIKDLVDSVQKNLELKVLQKQRAYELNVQLGRLAVKAGRSVVPPSNP